MADRSNWEGMYVALGEGTQDVYIREAMYNFFLDILWLWCLCKLENEFLYVCVVVKLPHHFLHSTVLKCMSWS